MPQLADPNFLRATILVVSFDQEGAFGLIVNRTLDISAEQVLGEQIDFPEEPKIPVFFGGPVQGNSLWFIHGYHEFSENSVQVSEGVFVTSHLDTVRLVLKRHGQDDAPYFRFVLGYAGWAPGQLEQEISHSSWVMAPIQAHELFFCEPTKLWDKALARIGISDPGLLVSPQTSGAAN